MAVPGTVTAPPGRVKQWWGHSRLNPSGWNWGKNKPASEARIEAQNFDQATAIIKTAKHAAASFWDENNKCLKPGALDNILKLPSETAKHAIYGLIFFGAKKAELSKEIDAQYLKATTADPGHASVLVALGMLIDEVYEKGAGAQFLLKFEEAVDEGKKTGTPIDLLSMAQMNAVAQGAQATAQHRTNPDDERALDSALNALVDALLLGKDNENKVDYAKLAILAIFKKYEAVLERFNLKELVRKDDIERDIDFMIAYAKRRANTSASVTARGAEDVQKALDSLENAIDTRATKKAIKEKLAGVYKDAIPEFLRKFDSETAILQNYPVLCYACNEGESIKKLYETGFELGGSKGFFFSRSLKRWWESEKRRRWLISDKDPAHPRPAVFRNFDKLALLAVVGYMVYGMTQREPWYYSWFGNLPKAQQQIVKENNELRAYVQHSHVYPFLSSLKSFKKWIKKHDDRYELLVSFVQDPNVINIIDSGRTELLEVVFRAYRREVERDQRSGQLARSHARKLAKQLVAREVEAVEIGREDLSMSRVIEREIALDYVRRSGMYNDVKNKLDAAVKVRREGGDWRQLKQYLIDSLAVGVPPGQHAMVETNADFLVRNPELWDYFNVLLQALFLSNPDWKQGREESRVVVNNFLNIERQYVGAYQTDAPTLVEHYKAMRRDRATYEHYISVRSLNAGGESPRVPAPSTLVGQVLGIDVRSLGDLRSTGPTGPTGAVAQTPAKAPTKAPAKARDSGHRTPRPRRPATGGGMD